MFATVTLESPVAELPAFRTGWPRPGRGPVGSRGSNLSVKEQQDCPVTRAKLGSMGEPLAAEVDGSEGLDLLQGLPAEAEGGPGEYLARLAAPPRDEVLSVPESAVIDTGTRKVVYVEAEPGVFEGRQVVLGPRIGDRFPVLEGLEPGEKVAAAGVFLIDAESRLNLSSTGWPRWGGDPSRTLRELRPHG